MEDSDLHGNALPPPRRPLGKLKNVEITRRETPAERETNRRLDRTARFYEHIAPPAAPEETLWRHKHWQEKRDRVREALARCGTSPQTMANFDACGSTAVSFWSNSLQKRRLKAYYCHCRHCEPCARSKANKICANLKARLLAAGKHQYRFLTLTLKHSDRPLAEQIRRLFACFKQLRQKPEWKKSQEGGAFMLEVKWDGRAWHPHLHGVVQGKFVDKLVLSRLWHQVTGDSFIVDVRIINRGEDAAHYVTKYISKSTSDGVWRDPAAAQEWVIASRGLRTCNTFGSWRKLPLLQVSETANDWVAEDTLLNLFARARGGDIIAIDILTSLRPKNQPIDDEHGPSNFPCFPDGIPCSPDPPPS